MGKIIRLTENDLTILVKKIIKEDVDNFYKRRIKIFEEFLDIAQKSL